jgi:hypothetical protein
LKKEIIPLARQDKLVIQNFENETLVYDLETNQAFCLNQTSSIVWENCNGKNTVTEIVGLLSKETKSPVEEDLIWLALDQLRRENLLDEKSDTIAELLHFSRREVIKKIGLTSLVTLPLITGLVAPQAVHAASTCVPVTGGCVCPGNGTVGEICVGGTGCQPNCRCQRVNNGGGNNGNCVA